MSNERLRPHLLVLSDFFRTYRQMTKQRVWDATEEKEFATGVDFSVRRLKQELVNQRRRPKSYMHERFEEGVKEHGITWDTNSTTYKGLAVECSPVGHTIYVTHREATPVESWLTLEQYFSVENVTHPDTGQRMQFDEFARSRNVFEQLQLAARVAQAIPVAPSTLPPSLPPAA